MVFTMRMDVMSIINRLYGSYDTRFVLCMCVCERIDECFALRKSLKFTVK